MGSPKQYEVKRDVNGKVCVRVSCGQLNNRNYNVRITLGVSPCLEISDFYFLHPQTYMFMPVAMEANRRGVDIFSCISALGKAHIPIYQEVLPGMYFVTADAYFDGRTFKRNPDGRFASTLSLQKPQYKTVVSVNKELWVLSKVVPTPDAVNIRREQLITACLSAALPLVAG